MKIDITYQDVFYSDSNKDTLLIKKLSINDVSYETLYIDNNSNLGKYFLENVENIKEFYEADEDWNLTDNELFIKIQKMVQEYIDNPAKDLNYENGFYLASYYNSTNEKFKNEAIKFISFRDQCWMVCYGLINKYTNGEIRRPLSKEVLELLPKWS